MDITTRATRAPRLAAGLLAAAVALSCAVAPAAHAEKKAGTSGGDHCKPGALWQEVVVGKDGKETGQVRTVAVCGKDGNWVKVIGMTVVNGSVKQASATTTSARVSS
jgi:hypothetical protein